MNCLNDAADTLLLALSDNRWDVLSAFPTSGKKAPKKPVLTLSPEACDTSPCGFGALLGVRQSLDAAEEVFAVRANMTFGIGIYIRDPGKNASEALTALVSGVYKKLLEKPLENLRVHKLTAGSTTFDEPQRMFFRPIKLLCSTFYTFSGEDALPIQIDLSGRIHYEF